DEVDAGHSGHASPPISPVVAREKDWENHGCRRIVSIRFRGGRASSPLALLERSGTRRYAFWRGYEPVGSVADLEPSLGGGSGAREACGWTRWSAVAPEMTGRLNWISPMSPGCSCPNSFRQKRTSSPTRCAGSSTNWTIERTSLPPSAIDRDEPEGRMAVQPTRCHHGGDIGIPTTSVP